MPADAHLTGAAFAEADAQAAEHGHPPTMPEGAIRLATRGYVSWEGAKDVLAAVSARHPGRPVTLEAYAAGLVCGLVPGPDGGGTFWRRVRRGVSLGTRIPQTAVL